MAKKTEVTSKGVIRDLLSKAWEKVKELPRKIRGTKADVEAKELKRIAEKTDRSVKQIKDIKEGKRPGKNLLDPLKQIKRGRKVQAPPKEEKKVKARKKPEKKPEEKPPEKPPEPEKPPRPKRVKAVVRGNIGPYKDDDYIRERTIRPELSAELTTAFLDALDAEDEDRAARIAVQSYFSESGFAGYVESLTDSIDYEVVEE
jgi:outer membrane biosynthesis protein TonB